MKRVLILSSLVAASRVGGRVAVSAMEARGIEAVLVPSVLFGRHPGHGAPGGGPVADEQFGAMLEGVAAQGLFARFDAVLTGYFASAGQVEIAAAAIREIRKAAPDTIILVDPILGDEGQLYVGEATATAIRDQLVPLADIITPNAFELGWLTGKDTGSIESAREAARLLRKPALVSSVPNGESLSVLYEGGGHSHRWSHARVDNTPRGTGDLLAGEFLANRLEGWTIERSVHSAIRVTLDAVLRSRDDQTDTLISRRPGDSSFHAEAVVTGHVKPHRKLGDGPRWVLGVDGCPAGWIGVWYDIRGHASPRHQLFRSLDEIGEQTVQPQIIAIDMPIGFPDIARKGGRDCEVAARKLLPGKTSSVFSSPSRAALSAKDYPGACDVNSRNGGPRLSKQSFALFPKMREADAFKKSALGNRVYEAHPEVALAVLNRNPVVESKKTQDGRRIRLDILRRLGFPADLLEPHTYPKTRIAPDDLVDAAICAIVAQRIANGQHVTLPADPPVDADGIKMAIHA